MPNQPTRVMKALSKVPSVHVTFVLSQLISIITIYIILNIRGTVINKTFNLTFGEDGASWHFDEVEKDPGKAICFFCSQPNNSLVFLGDDSESSRLSQCLPICQSQTITKHMQGMSVGMRNCLGYAVVSNIPSLAPSFLFSVSQMECLRNKMLFGWRK